MRATLQAVADSALPALIVWPNSDPGHTGIIQAIETRPTRLTARVVRSLPHEDFLRALLAARAIVGNSSSGIIEAPAAGTPSVNIGPRQAGRLQDKVTTINCSSDRGDIATSIRRALREETAASLPCDPVRRRQGRGQDRRGDSRPAIRWPLAAKAEHLLTRPGNWGRAGHYLWQAVSIISDV